MAKYRILFHETKEQPRYKVFIRRKRKMPPVSEHSLMLSKKEAQVLKKLLVYTENLAEYERMRQKPGRMLMLNLVSGMAKGFGIALGITILAFIAFKLLTKLEILDLPIIGNFIEELLEYINNVQNFNLM